MQKHTKVYMDYFGYDVSDWIPCEICGTPAVDLHHVKPRSLGGTDTIDNLIALCRHHHIEAHDNVEFKIELQQIISKRNGPATERL